MAQAEPSTGNNGERLQNTTFPASRGIINDNFEALQTLNSGASAPATTSAYMPFVNTNTSSNPSGKPELWIRNATDDGWITVGVLDPTTFAVGGIAPIANGGTGATNASAAINALLPNQSGNAEKFLTTNGTVVSWDTAAAGVKQTVYTGNNTWTPESGRKNFLVFCIGGGGGTGSANANLDDNARIGRTGGGGSGGIAIRFYTLAEVGTNGAVTVGAAGAGAAAGAYNNGTDGGDSSFNPQGSGLTLTGGGGEKTGYANEWTAGGGGAGGTITNAQYGFVGEKGADGGTMGHSTGQRTVEKFTHLFSGTTASYGRGGKGRSSDGSGWSTGFSGEAGAVIVYEW